MPADRRGDLWFSLLLTALALAVVIESWRMPRLENLGVHPMSAPGLTPGVIGLVLLLLGLLLLVRSLRERRAAAARAAASAAPAAPAATAASGDGARALLATVLCLVYALGLLGRLPFFWATGLFVFAFVVAFAFERARPWRTLGGAAAMALFSAVSVTLLFERLFLVQLP
ncbi:MAG: tripartite tricarboxylate transporter TctB family protein [Rubrivivax sp.]|nr:tripartite tricarboxylate transporter TctB family protein [Rubrivivax sp.]